MKLRLRIRRKVRSRSMMTSTRSQQGKGASKKELNLLKTLAITVAIFAVCWLPYGGVILFDRLAVDHRVKKVNKDGRKQFFCREISEFS